MVKKTLKFENFNGEVVEETNYFNLSKLELTRMEAEYEGGLTETLKKVIEEENRKEILKFVEMLIQRAYGKRSEDGRKFVKNDELLEDFVASDYYAELCYNLLVDPEEATKFMTGVMPKVQNA